MKSYTYTILAVTSLGLGAAQAATVTWDNTSTDGNWYTATNWDTDTVPSVNDGTDNVIIDNGDAITHNVTGNPDLDVFTGSTVTVSGGSSVSQTVGNWQRLQGGTIALDNGTWTTTSNFRVGYDSGDAGGAFNLTNGSSATFGNEFWVGRPDIENTNVVFSMTIAGNSSVDFNGGVGLWLWDAHLTGNDYKVNFTGNGSIEGRIGYEDGGGTNNAITWEELWTAGILQHNGGNAGNFTDHFTTTGTAGTIGYTLTAVPEPSSTALLGLGGLALIMRRRK